MTVAWNTSSSASDSGSSTESNAAALNAHVPSASITLPLIFPFAATVILTNPHGRARSPNAPLEISLPSNVPTTQSGNASTLSVIVAIWFASPFFDAVNVTV